MLTASTRHIRAAKAVLILLGIAACFASPCFASPCFARPSFAVDRDAPPLPPLKVGVYIDPPFTMVSSGGFYSGYAIELWNLIEQKLGRSSTIENFKTFPEFLDAAATGKVDIAVGASFVTLMVACAFPSTTGRSTRFQGSGAVWSRRDISRSSPTARSFWLVSARR